MTGNPNGTNCKMSLIVKVFLKNLCDFDRAIKSVLICYFWLFI